MASATRATWFKYCVVIVIAIFSHQARADSARSKFEHTQGTKIVDDYGDELYLNGMNLGNWLLWEDYLIMGDFEYRTHSQFLNSLTEVFGSEKKAAEFQHQWRLNYVDQEAISDLKGLGFNAVRVPFHFNLF